MSTYDSHDHESTDLDDRTERALTEHMGILPEGGDLYTVVGENHPDREESTYTVDLRRGRCSCRDARHRGVTCKHQRRVLFATGAEPVPAAIGPADVPGELGGEHLEGEPRYLATDGGRRDDRTRVPVAGGVLVYEEADLGKELVGVEDVTDWDALADGLAARGHGRGAVYHLEELDASFSTPETEANP